MPPAANPLPQVGFGCAIELSTGDLADRDGLRHLLAESMATYGLVVLSGLETMSCGAHHHHPRIPT